MKINLGCGKKYLQGYINCDISKNVHADIYFNLNTFPYPFKANTADEILIDNVLNIVDDVVQVIDECYRILKPGGKVRIFVPYGKTDWALQDPTAKHYFTERSMHYFTTEWEYNFYSNARFKLLENTLYCNTNTFFGKCRNLVPFKRILRFYLFNIYDEIYFELEKIKS